MKFFIESNGIVLSIDWEDVFKGMVKILLLEDGMDVNQKSDEYGGTALYIA